MILDGPFAFATTNGDDPHTREFHLTFKPWFQAAGLEERIRALDAHLAALRSAVREAGDDEHEQQGMMIVLQVVEALAPRIKADELPLEEPLIFEVSAESEGNPPAPTAN